MSAAREKQNPTYDNAIQRMRDKEAAEVNLHNDGSVGLLWLSRAPASAAHAAQSYVPEASTCDGYPRADIGMAEGLCAGLVMAPKEGAFRSRQIKTPRGAVSAGRCKELARHRSRWMDRWPRQDLAHEDQRVRVRLNCSRW